MWTLPNLLTIARAVAVLPVVACILGGWWATAFGIFVAAALTDFLDGWLARRWNQTSEFGRFLDPIADKLMVAGVLVALVDGRVVAGTDIWPVVAILVREFLVSGLREFLGPKGVTVHVSGLAKWKTTLQLVAVAVVLLAQVWPGVPDGVGVAVAAWSRGAPVLLAGLALLWAAAALTILTGAQYLGGGLRYMRSA